VDGFLAWLQQLPAVALYGMLGFLAFLENVFPPAPADTVIAFSAFLAAQGQASLAWCLGVVIGGHLVGAGAVYAVGRRWGAERVRRWLAERGEATAEATFEGWYQRYGFWALLTGRFIPFIRGVVPLAAGALRIPLWSVLTVTLLHAAAWYGLITYVAYRVGENFDALVAAMRRGGTTLGVAAGAVAAVAVGVWWWRRRRRSGRRG
jgi:membrane protein DedA with SNARE-associated domain